MDQENVIVERLHEERYFLKGKMRLGNKWFKNGQSSELPNP